MSLETVTSSAVGGLAPAKVVPDIVQKVRELSILSAFVCWFDLTAKGAEAVKIPRETSTASVTDITPGSTEADAQGNSQVTSDSVTCTAVPSSIHLEISEWLDATSLIDWERKSESIALRAMLAKIETGIATIFAGFSGRQGLTGQDLSVLFMDAALTDFGSSALEVAGNGVICLHRAQMGQLRQDLVSGTGSALSTVWSDGELANIFGMAPNSNIFQSAVGKWYNVPLFQTNYVTKVNTDTDYCGAIFAASPGMSDINAAIAGAMKWVPQIEHFSKGGQNKLANVTRGKLAVGFAEILDGNGIGILGAV